jgi:putative nicotinate phosphoribosyltransferase
VVIATPAAASCLCGAFVSGPRITRDAALFTMLASKAIRSVLAADGRAVVDFGLRRTHGIDAGMAAARCAFIAGASMTSNALASYYDGIPATGTMADSYVTAFPTEIEAFRAFARALPLNTTSLLHTYDTVAAAHKAVIVAREMEGQGSRLAGVRWTAAISWDSATKTRWRAASRPAHPSTRSASVRG